MHNRFSGTVPPDYIRHHFAETIHVFPASHRTSVSLIFFTASQLLGRCITP
jgi:hypothetical protein